MTEQRSTADVLRENLRKLMVVTDAYIKADTHERTLAKALKEAEYDSQIKEDRYRMLVESRARITDTYADEAEKAWEQVAAAHKVEVELRFNLMEADSELKRARNDLAPILASAQHRYGDQIERRPESFPIPDYDPSKVEGVTSWDPKAKADTVRKDNIARI